MTLLYALKKKKIKFAAFDLDGTLLDSNGNIFVNTIQGLLVLKNQDIEMFIVTGRTIDSFLSLNLPKEFLNLFNENIICNDGAILYNINSGLIKSYFSINPELILKVIEISCNKNDIVFEINGKHFSPEKAPALKYSMIYKINRNFINVKNIKIYSVKSINKFVIFPKQNEIEKIMNSLESANCIVKKLNFLDAIEITPKEACKAKGLLNFLSESYNIKGLNNVIAFGDGINDCTLLKNSKIGVSVINSHHKAIENSNIHANQLLGDYLIKNLNDF